MQQATFWYQANRQIKKIEYLLDLVCLFEGWKTYNSHKVEHRRRLRRLAKPF